MHLGALLTLGWSACTCSGPVHDSDGDTVADTDTSVETGTPTETAHPETAETGPAETGETATPSSPPNVLFVVADDFGLEASACYDDIGTDKAPQPTLTALCEQGVVFDTATAYPACSPTRASVFTGRYGFRNGVTEPLERAGVSPEIDEDELTLPMVLTAAERASHANIGKWHLTRDAEGPNRMGWAHFEGALEGEITDFYAWDKTTNGKTEAIEGYAPTVNVDDALAWVAEQDDPWFLWLAFNSAHTPWHVPPAELHTDTGLVDDEATIEEQPAPYFDAMVEAMDTELGRLLDGLDEDVLANTWIVFLGDNGSESAVNDGAYSRDRAKSTLYQGGVHVPLVVVGPGVTEPGRRSAHVVDTVDLFPTLLELAEVDWEPHVPAETTLDGRSLLPYLEDPDAEAIQTWAYTELHGERTEDVRGGYAVRDSRWKLVVHLDGKQELYDLSSTYVEGRDLMGQGGLDDEQQAAYDALLAQLTEVLDSGGLSLP